MKKIVKNQRVIQTHFFNYNNVVDDCARWLDELIGNRVGNEIVSEIITFQIIPLGDYLNVVALINTELAKGEY